MHGIKLKSLIKSEGNHKNMLVVMSLHHFKCVKYALW